MATPDWEAIETAYRAGVLSLRDIGEQYGVTEGAIRKRAKKFGWVRKTGTQVRKMVRKPVRKRKGAYHREARPPGGTQKVRNQNQNLHQIRNRYADRVPILQPIHFRPVISKR